MNTSNKSYTLDVLPEAHLALRAIEESNATYPSEVATIIKNCLSSAFLICYMNQNNKLLDTLGILTHMRTNGECEVSEVFSVGTMTASGKTPIFLLRLRIKYGVLASLSNLNAYMACSQAYIEKIPR